MLRWQWNSDWLTLSRVLQSLHSIGPFGAAADHIVAYSSLHMQFRVCDVSCCALLLPGGVYNDCYKLNHTWLWRCHPNSDYRPRSVRSTHDICQQWNMADGVRSILSVSICNTPGARCFSWCTWPADVRSRERMSYKPPRAERIGRAERLINSVTARRPSLWASGVTCPCRHTW